MFRRSVCFGGVAAVATVLALTGASSTVASGTAIEPGTRVNGMLVVQGIAQEANVKLFDFCDPVVLTAGRRTRSCGLLPPARRLFAGHGIFAPKKRIEAAWDELTWDMWIDGKHVTLSGFGHSDRWLFNYPPADGNNVVLREWAIILLGAAGRHSIRYRTRWPQQGVFDTTWKFRVRTQ